MFNCRARCLFFICFFIISFTLHAQEERRISFNGFSGVALLPPSQKINSAGQPSNIFGGYSPAIAFGAGVNYRFNPKYSLGNNLFFFFSSKKNFSLNNLGLKSVFKYYPLKDIRKFSPYVSAGLNLNLVSIGRKQYSDSIFPNTMGVIGPGINVSKIVYNYEALKLSFVPIPGVCVGAGVNFKLSDKVNLFLDYSYNYNLAKMSGLLKEHYFSNKANLTYHFATAGVTFKLLKPRKQLLATLNRDAWDGDPAVTVRGTIVYKKEKKSNEKIVPVLFTNTKDSTLSIEPTDTKGIFEQRTLRTGDYKYMLERRNRNIVRADLQIIHNNRKVDIFDDYPELALVDDFDSDNIISRDNNFSVILREGFQHEVDITVLANSLFGKVTPIQPDTLCRNVLVLLRDMNDSTLTVASPEKDCSFKFENVEPGPHKVVFMRKPGGEEMKFKYEFIENPPLIKKQYNTEEDSVELYLNSIVDDPEIEHVDINDLLLDKKYDNSTDVIVPPGGSSAKTNTSVMQSSVSMVNNNAVADPMDTAVDAVNKTKTPGNTGNKTNIQGAQDPVTTDNNKNAVADPADTAVDPVSDTNDPLNTNNNSAAVKPAGSKKVLVPLRELKAGSTYSVEGEEKYPSGYGVQIASFSSLANLKRFCDKFKKTRKESLYIQVLAHDENKHNVVLYRVVVGEFTYVEAANKAIESLKAGGYDTVLRKHRSNIKE